MELACSTGALALSWKLRSVWPGRAYLRVAASPGPPAPSVAESEIEAGVVATGEAVDYPAYDMGDVGDVEGDVEGDSERVGDRR